jgi:ATP-dependent Clp protease ATP-binding subunit ClpC
MFERYTEFARRSLFFARYKASALGGAAITPEHLLLGVLRQPRHGVAAHILARAAVDEASLQGEITKACGAAESVPASFEIPFSETAKRILYRAAEEADALGHESIGPEHLVLAVLSEGTSDAARILIDRGVGTEGVRDYIERSRRSPK